MNDAAHMFGVPSNVIAKRRIPKRIANEGQPLKKSNNVERTQEEAIYA